MTSLVSRMLDAMVDGLEPLVRRRRPRRRAIVVDSDAGFRFFEADRKGVRQVAEGEPAARELRRLRRAGRDAVELRLAPERLIARTLQLPAAGREYLAPIIEHRLERLTPWRPDRVAYGYAVAGEAAPDGSMGVDFLATSTEIVAERAERLARLQLAPTAIGSAAEPLETPLRIDLYRGGRDAGRRRLRRRVALALVLVFATVVPAFAVSQWLSLEAETRLADLERRLAVKRQVLRTATGDTAAESRDLRLIGGKVPGTAAMVMVDRLAGLLPDGTWLRELEIDGAEVRIVGWSADAPALIPMLEADEALAGVQFAAPVTRDENGRDDFDIVARWVAREAPPADGSDGSDGAGGSGEPFRTGALP